MAKKQPRRRGKSTKSNVTGKPDMEKENPTPQLRAWGGDDTSSKPSAIDPAGRKSVVDMLVAVEVLCEHIHVGCGKWTEEGSVSTHDGLKRCTRAFVRMHCYSRSVLAQWEKSKAGFAGSGDRVVVSALKTLGDQGFEELVKKIRDLCRGLLDRLKAGPSGDFVRELNAAFLELGNLVGRVRKCAEDVLNNGIVQDTSCLPSNVRSGITRLKASARKLARLYLADTGTNAGQAAVVPLLQDRIAAVGELKEKYEGINYDLTEFVKERLREIRGVNEQLASKTQAVLEMVARVLEQSGTFSNCVMLEGVSLSFDAEAIERSAAELRRVTREAEASHCQLTAMLQHAREVVARAPFRHRPTHDPIPEWEKLSPKQQCTIAALVAIRESDADREYSAANRQILELQLGAPSNDSTLFRSLCDLTEAGVVGDHPVVRIGGSSRGMIWYFLYEESYEAYCANAMALWEETSLRDSKA